MYYIGLMSGTSMDAVDAALVQFEDDSPILIAYEQYPIPDEIRQGVRKLSPTSTLDDVSRLDVALGRLFATAVKNIIKTSNLKPENITAIGSHGQTILHLPETAYPRTLQIGDPNIIAYQTGITTIADFRRMDMAAGGQGAPLASAFHADQCRSNTANRAILNIGGIANLTLLPADESTDVFGFDTGPGNGLLDDWNQLHNGTEMDKNGNWAKTGKVNQALLGLMQGDPYFHRPPPKSTGRDEFNLDWLKKCLKSNDEEVSPADVQATLLALTVHSIADAIENHAPQTEEIYVCGGGVHNPALMDGLRLCLTEISIDSTAVLSINPDTVEAITFAWLAKRRMDNSPGNLPMVTGAEQAVLLGAIYTAY